VYGDKPNYIKLKEENTRWEYDDPTYINGIPETFSIDHSTHSLFGASKVAADVLVQEYGNYFQIPTVCLRGGCLTGENHSGVELHGFLNYIIKCCKFDIPYTIFGYKGKQVRDNIHSSDVIQFMELFIKNPKIGAVYNIGGGKSNSCSIVEIIEIINSISKKKLNYTYTDENRKGDHICYYSDLTKMKKDYPEFKITKTLEYIVEKIYKN
jgi:CDP-paratose 2-epimerase